MPKEMSKEYCLEGTIGGIKANLYYQCGFRIDVDECVGLFMTDDHRAITCVINTTEGAIKWHEWKMEEDLEEEFRKYSNGIQEIIYENFDFDIYDREQFNRCVVDIREMSFMLGLI